MRVCTICGAKWRGEPAVCPLDGGALRELPDPLLGRTIGGRYRIAETLGAGGMGKVYCARDERVGRDVAIKLLAPDLARDATHRQRFLREAKAANRIDHEHIIRIAGYGETDDGLVYLAMEYLEGEPLSAAIERGPLPPQRAIVIGAQIAAALGRAHALGVIHRDIKPSNVFLLKRAGGGDFVKLLDFGLARMKGEIRLTAGDSVLGTPDYMAPEQARGAPLTGKADLYALGCLLFEMTTGRPPFAGPLPELVLKHVREPAPSLRSRVPSAPVELDALVAQLLEKDPARRPADADRVGEALRAMAGVGGGATLREDRPGAEATPSAWRQRARRFWELAERAYPEGAPRALTDALRALDATVDALGVSWQQLDEASSAARRKEDETHALRQRLGGAIGALGEDEARALRALEELAIRLEDARGRTVAGEAALRQAWRSLGPAPAGDAPLAPQAVEALVEIGRLASAWLEAQRSLAALTSEQGQRTRERDDLRFQIAHMLGRLGTLEAGADFELSARCERASALEEAHRELLDQLAAQAAAIAEHLQARARA